MPPNLTMEPWCRQQLAKYYASGREICGLIIGQVSQTAVVPKEVILIYLSQQILKNQFHVINLPETHDAFYSLADSPELEDEVIVCNEDRRSIVHRLVWHATRVLHMLPGSFHVLGLFFVGVPWFEVGEIHYEEYVTVMKVLNKSVYVN